MDVQVPRVVCVGRQRRKLNQYVECGTRHVRRREGALMYVWRVRGIIIKESQPSYFFVRTTIIMNHGTMGLAYSHNSDVTLEVQG